MGRITAQVNGKSVKSVTVDDASSKACVMAQSLRDPEVSEAVGGRSMLRAVFVPGRLVNFVVCE